MSGFCDIDFDRNRLRHQHIGSSNKRSSVVGPREWSAHAEFIALFTILGINEHDTRTSNAGRFGLRAAAGRDRPRVTVYTIGAGETGGGARASGERLSFR